MKHLFLKIVFAKTVNPTLRFVEWRINVLSFNMSCGFKDVFVSLSFNLSVVIEALSLGCRSKTMMTG